MSQKLLYVMGGILVGDTFHCIPYLNKFVEEGATDITWVAGTYAKGVTEFISSFSCFNIGTRMYLADGNNPDGFGPREQFARNFVSHRSSLGTFDKEFVDPGNSFDWQSERKDDMRKYLYFNHGIQSTKGDYICVQCSSIHKYKRVPAMMNIKYPLPVKSLGLPGEEIIPGSEDCRGLSWEQIVKLIMGCKMFVGIHSALSVLSFYCNKPTVLVFFGGAGIRFGKYRSNCVDVLNPVVDLQRVVDEVMVRENV